MKSATRFNSGHIAASRADVLVRSGPPGPDTEIEHHTTGGTSVRGPGGPPHSPHLGEHT